MRWALPSLARPKDTSREDIELAGKGSEIGDA
jgi:hypothetical protein